MHFFPTFDFYCIICAFWWFRCLFAFLYVCGQYNLSNTNLQLTGEGGKAGEGYQKNGRTLIGRTFWDRSIRTVPFFCLLFPCQDWFLPVHFTLCVSQNSLAIGLTMNGVSISCTIVYASLWQVAAVYEITAFLSFFPLALLSQSVTLTKPVLKWRKQGVHHSIESEFVGFSVERECEDSSLCSYPRVDKWGSGENT